MGEKKLGVYVNGKLKLQTRDRTKADDAFATWTQTFGNDVWIAPVGSFVNV